MKISFPALNAQSQEVRERFEGYAAEIVCETFIFPADRDYLTARFAYFQKQSHLFLWSAAQALEKYLKANILLLSSERISRTHRLTSLAKSMRNSGADRLDFDLTIPTGWPQHGVAYWPKQTVDGYLARMEAQGSPDVRYNQVQLNDRLQDLVYLDRLAFRLREGLVLESVNDCQLVGNQLKSCFFDLNYPFAPADHEHPPLQGLRLAHTSVSTLEVALNGGYGHAHLYRDWVEMSMGLNSKDIDRLSHSKKSDP